MTVKVDPVPLPSHGTLPLVPLKASVYVPSQDAVIFVGRARSMLALDHVAKGSPEFVTLCQRDDSQDPGPADFFGAGTRCVMQQAIKLPPAPRTPDGCYKLHFIAQQRIRAVEVIPGPFLQVSWEAFPLAIGDPRRASEALEACRLLFLEWVDLMNAKQADPYWKQVKQQVDRIPLLEDRAAYIGGFATPLGIEKQRVYEEPLADDFLQGIRRMLEKAVEELVDARGSG